MENIDQPLTKKQRRELKKQEKLENKNKEKVAKIKTQIIVWVAVVLLIGGGIYFLMNVDSTGVTSDVQIDTINSETDHTKGNTEAELVLIEYSDFQCPACSAYQDIVNQLIDEYNNQIHFAFRHFPISSIHNNAQIAAQATEASDLQNKFWEMHDKLFANQSDWSNESDPTEKFVAYARELELNIEKFKTDLVSEVTKNKVDDDYTSGSAAKVNSTPSFFLNGNKIKNPQTLDEFKDLINEELGMGESETSESDDPIVEITEEPIEEPLEETTK